MIATPAGGPAADVEIAPGPSLIERAMARATAAPPPAPDVLDLTPADIAPPETEKETTMDPIGNPLLARLLNVHTIKAIGVALAAFGLLTPEKVQEAIDGSGGSWLLAALGVAGYVVANILRKA